MYYADRARVVVLCATLAVESWSGGCSGVPLHPEEWHCETTGQRTSTRDIILLTTKEPTHEAAKIKKSEHIYSEKGHCSSYHCIQIR